MKKIADVLNIKSANTKLKRKGLAIVEKWIKDEWVKCFQESKGVFPEKVLSSKAVTYESQTKSAEVFKNFVESVNVDLLNKLKVEIDETSVTNVETTKDVQNDVEDERVIEKPSNTVMVMNDIIENNNNNNNNEGNATIVDDIATIPLQISKLHGGEKESSQKKQKTSHQGGHGPIHWFPKGEIYVAGATGAFFEELAYKEDETTKKLFKLGVGVSCSDGKHEGELIILAIQYQGKHYQALVTKNDEDFKKFLENEKDEGENLKTFYYRCGSLNLTGSSCSTVKFKAFLLKKFNVLNIEPQIIDLERDVSESNIAKRVKENNRRSRGKIADSHTHQKVLKSSSGSGSSQKKRKKNENIKKEIRRSGESEEKVDVNVSNVSIEEKESKIIPYLPCSSASNIELHLKFQNNLTSFLYKRCQEEVLDLQNKNALLETILKDTLSKK